MSSTDVPSSESPSTSFPPPTFVTTVVDQAGHWFKALTAPFVPLSIPHAESPPPKTAPSGRMAAIQPLPAVSPWIVPPPSDTDPWQDKQLYRPHGKYEWARDKLMHRWSYLQTIADNSRNLNKCSVYIAQGFLGDRQINYINKLWSKHNPRDSMFVELMIYKKHLRKLQGDVLPRIISVYSHIGVHNVAFELPHDVFWVTASPDMPHVLKKRAIEALQKAHDAKVVHHRLRMSRILICADGRVCIVDWHSAHAKDRYKAPRIPRVAKHAFEYEMRQLRFQLDYMGAREYEIAKRLRVMQRIEREQEEQRRAQLDPTYIPAMILADEDDVENPPVSDKEWFNEWVIRSDGPRRFVAPGITPEQLYLEIQSFFNLVDDWQAEDVRVNGPPTAGPSASSRTQASASAPPSQPKKSLKDLVSDRRTLSLKRWGSSGSVSGAEASTSSTPQALMPSSASQVLALSPASQASAASTLSQATFSTPTFQTSTFLPSGLRTESEDSSNEIGGSDATSASTSARAAGSAVPSTSSGDTCGPALPPKRKASSGTVSDASVPPPAKKLKVDALASLGLGCPPLPLPSAATTAPPASATSPSEKPDSPSIVEPSTPESTDNEDPYAIFFTPRPPSPTSALYPPRRRATPTMDRALKKITHPAGSQPFPFARPSSPPLGGIANGSLPNGTLTNGSTSGCGVTSFSSVRSGPSLKRKASDADLATSTDGGVTPTQDKSASGHQKPSGPPQKRARTSLMLPPALPASSPASTATTLSVSRPPVQRRYSEASIQTDTAFDFGSGNPAWPVLIQGTMTSPFASAHRQQSIAFASQPPQFQFGRQDQQHIFAPHLAQQTQSFAATLPHAGIPAGGIIVNATSIPLANVTVYYDPQLVSGNHSSQARAREGMVPRLRRRVSTTLRRWFSGST